MRCKTITSSAVILMTGLLLAGTAHAFDMGNMMNPSKWMGGKDKDDDRYYDDYYGDPGYGGQLYNLSQNVGCIGPKAWCNGDTTQVFFLGKEGLYQIPANAGGMIIPVLVSAFGSCH